jgi:hypothetical protein
MPEQLFHQALSFQALEVLELIDQSGANRSKPMGPW